MAWVDMDPLRCACSTLTLPRTGRDRLVEEQPSLTPVPPPAAVMQPAFERPRRTPWISAALSAGASDSGASVLGSAGGNISPGPRHPTRVKVSLSVEGQVPTPRRDDARYPTPTTS